MADDVKLVRCRHSAVLAIVAVILLSSQAAGADIATPILVYHRFGPTARDGMTVRTAVFERQLEALMQHGYTVVPLRALVAYLRDAGSPLPRRAVVLTVDDAHRSVYTDMLPVLRRHPVPVTLFVYPSAISNAAYALTWDELRELRATGLIEVQSHTYWHPNFLEEKRRLPAEAYERLVETQLARSKAVLEARLGATVDFVSWPFGIHDEDLRRRAARAGYVAGVALGRRHATALDPIMALPRYLITDADQGARFEALLEGRAARGDAVIGRVVDAVISAAETSARTGGCCGIRTTSTHGTEFDPGDGRVTIMTARNAVTRNMVEEFAERLARARRAIYATVATTDEELATLEAHQAGNLTEDAVTEVVTTILSRLEGREKHALDEIDAAQARLAAGTYGVCEHCGRAIPIERLRAILAARYCVACQHREER